MKKIIFFDTETTGLSREKNKPVFWGHRIVEIAFLTLCHDERLEPFQQYINPGQAVSAPALAVHGLTNHFLEQYHSFEAYAENIIEVLAGGTLVAHNASFDLAFLNFEFEKAGFKPVLHYCKEVIDTLEIARKKYPGQKNSLDALCQRFQISIAHRSFHGALKDCYLLSRVYRHLVQEQRTIDLFSDLPAEAEEKILVSSEKQLAEQTKFILSDQEKAAHESFISLYCS